MIGQDLSLIVGRHERSEARQEVISDWLKLISVFVEVQIIDFRNIEDHTDDTDLIKPRPTINNLLRH